MPLEPSDQRHLEAARGYIALGMHSDANEELEQIDATCRQLPEVLSVRLAVYQTAKNWELAVVVAKQLAAYDPRNPHWPLALSYATRRTESLDAAKLILLEAAAKHPDEPIIQYNLARYECQLGNLDAAKDHLKRATKLQPQCAAMALNDPDLEPLWQMIAGRE